MQYPSEFSVIDVNGNHYMVTSNDEVKLNPKCSLLHAVNDIGNTFIVKLFDYQTEQEAQILHRLITSHDLKYSALFADVIPLCQPFAGYVIDAEGGQLLLHSHFNNIRDRCVILSKTFQVAETLEKQGYAICAGADDAFLVTRSNRIKYCAPDCLYTVGDFVRLEGPELCRPPEAFPPGFRIADAAEFSYYAACIVCRQLLGKAPLEEINWQELDSDSENPEIDPFEFDDNYEFVDQGSPRLFPTLHSLDEKENMIVDADLITRIEQCFCDGKINWYRDGLANKIGEKQADQLIKLQSSEELFQMMISVFNNPTIAGQRPGIRQWVKACMRVAESASSCPRCHGYFQLETLYSNAANPSTLTCIFKKCGARLGRIYRLKIAEFFQDRVDEPCRNTNGTTRQPFKRLLETRLFNERDPEFHSVKSDFLFEDSHMHGYDLLQYGWYSHNGKEGPCVKLFCFDDSNDIKTVFHSFEPEAKIEAGDGYTQFLMKPQKTAVLATYIPRETIPRHYPHVLLVTVSEVE